MDRLLAINQLKTLQIWSVEIVYKFPRFFQQLGGWLAVLLLVSLSACTAPVDDGVVHLALWQGVNPPSNRAVLQKLVDRFNQTHPQIQVESLYVGQADQQMPKILAAVVGDAAPDLLWYGPMITGQLVELGAIQPIDDYWQKSAVARQIDRALDSSMLYKNQRWSVPFGTNNMGIFYRPDLFRAAGVTKIPQNWSELRSVAKQLTNADHHGILLPLGKGEWSVFSWLPFMWSGGGELAAVGTDLANSGALKALQLWRDLLDDGSATLSMPERGYELDRFLAGKVAMQVTGPWTLGQLAEMKVEYDVMPIPADVAAHTVVGGESLFMMKNKPNRAAAAWQFMEYVLGEDFQREWALGTGYLPVNLEARKSAGYQDFVRKMPGLAMFVAQAARGKSRPISPGYSEISEDLGRAIEAVLLGRATPEVALAEAQRRWKLTQ
jgi:multiple sugar transport system substrate-binding protein